MGFRFVVVTALVAGSLQASAPDAIAQAGRDTARAGALRTTPPGTARAGAARVAPAVDDSILKSSAHTKLVCVACHTSLDPKRDPYRGIVEPVVCLRCHENAQFKHPFHPGVAAAIRSGAKPTVACKECHGAHDVQSAKVAGSPFSAPRLAESCGKCHEKAAERFKGSAHSEALANDVKGAPTCLSCHRQGHLVLARGASDSLAVKTAQARACLSCHLDGKEARDRVSDSTVFVPRWDRSMHGARLQHGDSAAATCVSCHGSHEVLKKSAPGSSIGKDSVVVTCAKCHTAIETKFNKSVHGRARTSTKTDSVTCATCHAEHAKLGAAELPPDVTAKLAAAQACARCHDPVALSAPYGIASDRYKDFSDSYHGFAVRGGVVEAANCASCHGAHDVKAKDDTTSSVAKAHLAATCGKCHKGANERFDSGPVHGKIGERARPDRPWLLPSGLLLIAGVAGGLFFFGRRRRA